MPFPRIPLLALVFLLFASPSRALWSDVAPTDSLWTIATRAKIFLVRTGDARLDDGIEQGFATAWPSGSWSWIPDSGIARMVQDSTVLLFRLVETRNPYRRTRERDCQKLTGEERTMCLDEQAGGRFRLEIGGRKLGYRSGTMLLEAPSQARRMPLGDAFVVDLPKDFALVLQAVRDSGFPAGGPFRGTRYWAREAVVRARREHVKDDTLWVLQDQVGPGGVEPFEKSFGGPVRAVPAGEFESMLGTARTGSYLEAGLLPATGRQLRVRSLSSGELLLIDDGPGRDRGDTLLQQQDFLRLAHRAAGEELRPCVLISGGFEGSLGGLVGTVVTGGYEFRRGWWGLLGWANWSSDLTLVPETERDHVLVGIRYTPFLAWENPDLGSPRWLRSRLALGLRYWQPYGESDTTGADAWLGKLYPHITFDIDLLADFWYIGASPEVWFGKSTVGRKSIDPNTRFESRGYEPSFADGGFSDGGWSFRLGFHYGFADWRPGVSWRSVKERIASGNR